jgi:hypothetical protein
MTSYHRKVSAYTEQYNTWKRAHTSLPQAGLEPVIALFNNMRHRSSGGHADWLHTLSVIRFKNLHFGHHWLGR